MTDYMPRKDVELPPTISEAKLMARIEELETKLAKAVEALTFFLSEYDAPDDVGDAADKARTTLAELKGETDE